MSIILTKTGKLAVITGMLAWSVYNIMEQNDLTGVIRSVLVIISIVGTAYAFAYCQE